MQNKPPPVPAIDFSESKTGQSVADLFNKEMKIYVTPTDYFTTKFRKIFKKPKIKVTTAKYARPWIKGPNMSFWQQQLNFALWCATTGCGVSREMLFPNLGLNLSEQICTFYQFHVYYTTRKILYEMGGIQSKNALPDDEAFNEIHNPYDVAAYKRVSRSLVLTQVLISATHEEKTVDSVLCTFGLLVVGLRLSITTIQTPILLCWTMSGSMFQTMMAKALDLSNQVMKAIKQTASLSCEMIRAQKSS